MNSKVFITETNYSDETTLKNSLKSCFDHVGGIQQFIKDIVFIKINATTLESHSITSPDVIFALIKVIKENCSSVKKIHVFDNSAAILPTRVVFKMDHLAKKIKKLGANPLYLDELESFQYDFKGKALDKPIPLPKMLYEYVVEKKEECTYINLPKLKTHLQTSLTCCIKNHHGIIYDEEKLYHHHLIEEKITEIIELFRPDINIVDATKVINNGAILYRDDWEIPMNLLLSGEDPVAVDTVGAKLLGIPIDEVKHLSLASEKGLGINDLDKIDIIPSKDVIEGRCLTLNSNFDKISLDLAKNFKILPGKSHDGCRAGCRGMMEYFKIMTMGAETKPVIAICGKGHDKTELDQLTGTIFVVGPCAIEELKNYFEQRQDIENLNIHYIDDHFPMVSFMRPFIKEAKLPLKQLSLILKMSMPKIITGLVAAKLHKAKYVGIF